MNLVEWAVATMDTLGAPGVALLIFLENIFPPIPSEVILPLAGVTAAGPGGSYPLMLLASVIGSVSGAWVLYGLGRLLGPERLRTIFLRLPLLSVQDFDRTVDWMDRHGFQGVFFGRMVPGVRSLISIPAGLYAMPFGKFTLLTAAGSAIWNTVFLTAGFVLGANWRIIEPYTDLFSTVIYAVIAVIGLWILGRLLLREVRRRRAGEPDPDDVHRMSDPAAEDPAAGLDPQAGPAHGNQR